MRKDLKGVVCVVTGASRGIGRGIAISLGENGATVYVTGRTIEPKGDKAGSLKEVVEEIQKRGGNGIAVPLDHNDETQISNLFARIKKEQNGRLDLFVNNAFSAVGTVIEDSKNPRNGFWDIRQNETPGEYWDSFNKVGLRNAYVSCCLAARMMLEYHDELGKLAIGEKRKSPSVDASLIVNLSSAGANIYLFNPAYTAGKAATDKMSADMALELKKHQSSVGVISLWPGPVATEQVQLARQNNCIPENVFPIDLCETTELSGRVISHLMRQSKKKILNASGSVVRTAQYARYYWIKDANGKYPIPTSSLKFILKAMGWHKLAIFVPSFIQVPDSLFKIASKRFF